MTAPTPAATARALGLAALLGASGVLHLARPRVYRGLIPRALGDPGPWVLGSGIAELACAGLLAVPATRRAGGLASAALLVAVLPGNVTMAVRSRPGGRVPPAVAWARLPLQVPLVAWAVRVARDAPPPRQPATRAGRRRWPVRAWVGTGERSSGGPGRPKNQP